MRDLGHVEIGSLKRLNVTFALASVPTDPIPTSAVQFRITSPVTRTVTNYAYGDGNILRSGVGLYYVRINLNEPGVWYGRWHVDYPNSGQAPDDFAIVCDPAGDSTLYP